MMLTDTHIHLYAEAFDADRDKLVAEAKAAGISRFFLPNIDSSSLDGMFHLCEQYPQNCYPMAGLHPCSVKENVAEELRAIRTALDAHRKNIIAIGEIGLDFYWDLTFRKEQEAAFREQTEWAVKEALPVVIHSRNATDELIAILKEINDPRLTGVFHCFSGNLQQAHEIINLGFYLGIGGVVTFKNSGLDAVVKELPVDRILLETDGPYLAPVPHRGKRNEPAFLKLVAGKVAELKGITVEELAAVTSDNAGKVFQLTGVS